MQLLHQALKRNGYSTTKARQLVFEALEHEEPLSTAQLFTKVDGMLDRATLYRTIDLFEKLGIVQRIQLGWKHAFELTDNFSFHHHHLNCISCGILLPIREDVTIEEAVRTLATEYGFTSTSHQFEIRGLCPNCSVNN